MTRYTVTTELKTPWYFKVLRWFKLKEPRMEFDLLLVYPHFEIGSYLNYGGKENYVKIVSKFKTL